MDIGLGASADLNRSLFGVSVPEASRSGGMVRARAKTRAAYRPAKSLAAGALIGSSLVVAIFAVGDANADGFQNILWVCSPILFLAGVTVQIAASSERRVHDRDSVAPRQVSMPGIGRDRSVDGPIYAEVEDDCVPLVGGSGILRRRLRRYDPECANVCGLGREQERRR
jgi:hypothetical protein